MLRQTISILNKHSLIMMLLFCILALSFSFSKYRNAFSASLSGYFRNGSAYDQGSTGYFWSSSWDNYSGMYRLGVGSFSMSSYASARYDGNSIRCIAGS
ncbi:hypothetical protein IKF21_00615 [Candidatus Saccharibacteria bacterium]|nr:hypothetical protein [Candidatus Saccharibacteria bacterium]